MKFLKSDFDKNTGITTVSLSTDRGIVTGTTRLQNGDKESYMIGGMNAEWRAKIKYMKIRIKEVRIELKTLTSFEKRLKCLKDYNPYSLESRKLRRAIYEKEKELNDRIKLLNTSKEKYLESQEKYEKTREKLAKGKNN